MSPENFVVLGKKVEQKLDSLPPHILTKFRGWIKFIELYGIQEARLIKSFHDEPLKGNLQGQRSVRLNRSYRAIYVELVNEEIKVIQVIEVHKHDY